MGPIRRILHAVSTPTAVYVLVVLGLWFLVFELTQPGWGIAGLGGILALGLGAYGLACDSLGVAERVLEMTTAYGRERVQFDRPIGSFQAWKHRCADLFIQVEASRAALRAATWALDHNADDASARVSAAKFICGDGATLVAGDGVQLHGGIGYTWEHDMHLFQKRAKLNQALFGDSDYHRDRLAAAILP